MKKAAYLSFIFFVMVTGFVSAQTDAQLASQYMTNGEYEKAADLYKKLYNDNPNANYKNYYKCLLAINDYDGVEKLVDKQLKKTPENLTLYVDMGYAYEKQGKNKERDAVYQKAINNIKDQKQQVVQLANAFLTFDLIDLALQTYEKGQKNVEGYSFNYEMAGLIYRKGDLDLSIDLYLDYLAEDLQNGFTKVTSAFTKILDEEKDHALLQSKIIQRIQKSGNDVLYSELLIWDYVQQKDYEGAFIQAKALDKRYKENGERVFDLAETAKTEEQFDAAIEAYSYIISKGKETPYYFSAKNGILNCRKQKIFNTNTYTQQDIDELKASYLDFLNEYQRQDIRYATVTDDLAKLEAFYIHDYPKAIELLETVVNMPSLNASDKAQFKIDLGDFYLISGDVWEATLLYSQVDKLMKDEPLGELARYKNAKLAYYRGDFFYAQGLLDVLKAATTELVANDAMKLSVFITENLGLDSVLEPMKLYSEADLLVFQNKIPEAIVVLDTLAKNFPGHMLTDDILFLKAQIELKNKNVDSAVKYLEEIRQTFAFDLLADDAIFKLGEIYQYDYKDPEKAKLCYEQIILNYKDSLYINEARKRFRELRGDKLER